MSGEVLAVGRDDPAGRGFGQAETGEDAVDFGVGDGSAEETAGVVGVEVDGAGELGWVASGDEIG